MSSDSGYTWRPITVDDTDTFLRLRHALAEADDTGDHLGRDQVTETFASSYIDFPRGSVGVFTEGGEVEGGEMVAYCYLQARTAADPVHEFRMSGGVHPGHRGRGLGTRLLEWAADAVVPLHLERFPQAPLSLNIGTLVGHTAMEQLFADQGYQQRRWFNTMRIDLGRELPGAPLPEGVTVRTFAPECSEDARTVRNEAFRDHWGSTETSPEIWQQVTGGSAFRPDLTVVAYQDGEPLALVLTEEFDEYRAATGKRDLYIGLVGTRRSARGRGLASALLTQVLARARAEGFDTASLGVDADSPTGALGLYQRLGFRAEQVWVVQSKPIGVGAPVV
ncbi:GNAT family N-acetyltransferase [Streptacidiphilus sp. N1-10]|uniref:GNAT family N-acetyltransferase n=1 Tax=Streptacidiphilus jeojiensis TaxID=3229225 RepID=A0ABV6XMN2_9ACTN